MAIGVYAVERDYSHYVAYATNTVLAVLGTASKGPIGEPVLCTSSQDLANKFGPLKVGYHGLYAGQYFLAQSSQMYFIRVAGEDAAPAEVAIAGMDDADDTITNAIIFEMIDTGSYYNRFKLIVAESTLEDQYDITLKNSSDVIMEEIKGVSLADLVVGYTTKYMKVTAKDATIQSLVVSEGTYEFAGGDDGIEDIDYVTPAGVLELDKVDANLLVTPGVEDAEVINKILGIVESRGDMMYIIDTPKESTKGQVVEWVEKLNKSSYGAVYYDWVNIFDSTNKVTVKVPPSVVVGATYAYSDRVSELWYAPAGLSRGVISGVSSLVSSLTRSDIEALYNAHINSIYEDPQVGVAIWGQKTLYREATALNRVNVRRMMNYLKKIIVSACHHLVFEPNDRMTWNSFEMMVSPVLDHLVENRGIYEYEIVQGETIVTDLDIDNYRMPCMIMIKPTKAAEEIPIYFTITSTGADFNEVLEANGVID